MRLKKITEVISLLLWGGCGWLGYSYVWKEFVTNNPGDHPSKN